MTESRTSENKEIGNFSFSLLSKQTTSELQLQFLMTSIKDGK